jgi:hypothetical protein
LGAQVVGLGLKLRSEVSCSSVRPEADLTLGKCVVERDGQRPYPVQLTSQCFVVSGRLESEEEVIKDESVEESLSQGPAQGWRTAIVMDVSFHENR